MKKILVVVDMQNDFLTGSLPNRDAVKIIPNVVALINSGKYSHVVLTRDTHGEDYLETNEGKNLPIPHCIYGTYGWQIDTQIAGNVLSQEANKRICAVIIDKPTFGYKSWSQALSFIKEENFEIDFCGTCTDICVVSNALIVKSQFPEAKVNVISDACAGLSPEKHAAAISVMESCQIKAKKCNEV